MKKKITKKPIIKAILTILGRTYEAEGKTVKEVIAKLNPSIAKGMGVLRLEKGKLVREKVLDGRIINGTFGERSPMTKEINVKNIINLFSDFDE